VTNKVDDLASGRGARAFFLNPTKGRVEADVLIAATDDATWLECLGGCAARVLELLRKYYFGQEVEIADRTGEWTVLALEGPRSAAVLESVGSAPSGTDPGDHAVVRIAGIEGRAIRWGDVGEPGFHLWLPSGGGAEARGALLEAGAEPGDRETWTLLQIESGTPAYGRELTDETIPLEAPVGEAIHHAKGCYPGQEVIARLHVRGRPAKHLKGLRLDDGPPLAAGARLDAPDKTGVATVTASALSPEQGPIALAYVHRDYCAPGTSLAAEDGRRAEVVDLPFREPGS